MRHPFRRKALSGTPAVVESLQQRSAAFFSGLGGTNEANQRIKAAFARAQTGGYAWMYANSPAVRIVIDLVTRNVAQLDLGLFKQTGEAQRQAVPDHPAALSLRYPSAEQTSNEFVEAMVQNYLVFKNAYALKWHDPGTDQIVLKVIPPHRVEVFGMGLFDPDAYRIWRLDGSAYDVADPTAMLHWRGYNPEDQRLGLSPLETLRNVIAEDAALQQAVIELWKAGMASPSWVFRPDAAPEWSNDARKGFEEDLTNRLKKSNRRPVVLEEGMELRPYGVSPRDAQMLEVRKWALHQIGTAYGIPMGMLGIGEGREGDLNVAQSEFYGDTLPPITRSFAKMLDRGICQQEYDDKTLQFSFDLDEKHMGDARLAALTSASGRPVLLTNEARAMVNRPPVSGGDELVTPLNVIVGENPKPSPAVMGIQNPTGPAQDGSARGPALGPGQADKPEPTPPATPRDTEPKAVMLATKRNSIIRLHPRRAADKGRQYRYIDEGKALMTTFYRRQMRTVAAKSNGSVAFDRERWDRELADDLNKQMSSVIEREGGIWVARLAGSDFDMGRVQHWVAATASGVAAAVNDVTEQDIKNVGVDQAFQTAQNERIGTLATWLGTGPANFAREEAAQQAPDAESRVKVWIADTDRHAEFDGDTVALGDEWPAGFAPGSAPNCACLMEIQ